jgi:O-antigen/teichoic acid export membrane protein
VSRRVEENIVGDADGASATVHARPSDNDLDMVKKRRESSRLASLDGTLEPERARGAVRLVPADASSFPVSEAFQPTSDSSSDGVVRKDGATGRIGRGLAANGFGMSVTLVVQLVSVPVLLAAWGVPTYGEWLVLSAIPTYLALSDLSFSSVAGNSMIMLVAQGNRPDAISLGRRLWSIVTVITGIAVLAAVAIALLFGGVFGSGAAIHTSEAQMVLVALFLQVAVGNQYGVLDAWYRAGGRYPLGAALRQFGRLLEFGALMGAALLGARPGAAAIALLAGGVAGFGVSFIVLRRAVPWSTFRLELPRLQTFRELFSPGVAFMAFPLGTALSLQGMTIVVGAMLGSTAVAVFSTTRTVTRAVPQVLSAIGLAIWPEMSHSVGAGDLEKARAILRGATQLSIFVSVAFVVLLAAAGPQIIRWWTHGSVDPPSLLLNMLLLGVSCNTIWSVLSIALAATNRHRRMALVYLMGTVAALLVAVPLTATFGVAGAALALLAIDVAMVTYVLRAALRVIDDTPGEFVRALLDFRGVVRWAASKARAA